MDFWSQKLDLDLEKMKQEINHLINIHPYVLEFLEFCRDMGKKVVLVTNAHPKTLAIKMAKTEMAGECSAII
ncbi:MAG: haloacid dehalogenase, partial [Deltaproteobacteria bacterium]|nr:haloacid dehalogenase [Deltaproteobacteria bacterium]